MLLMSFYSYYYHQSELSFDNEEKLFLKYSIQATLPSEFWLSAKGFVKKEIQF